MIADYRVIALDPGTINTGLSVFFIDQRKKKIAHIEVFNLYSEGFICKESEDVFISHGEKYARLFKLRNAFKEYVKFYKPHVICSESPFFNIKRPGAFAPLVEVIYLFRDVSIGLDATIPFLLYEPRLIKKMTTGTANSNKDDMRAAIKHNTDISKKLLKGKTLDGYSEHCIDAIAVGWTHFRTLF